MPMSTTRRKMEIPVELYEAVAQAATDVGMPTATYASALLWEALQRRRSDLAPSYPFQGKKPYQRRRSERAHVADASVESRDAAIERPA